MFCVCGSEDDLERPIRAQKARPHIGQVWAGAVVEVEAARALRTTCFCCASAERHFLVAWREDKTKTYVDKYMVIEKR